MFDFFGLFKIREEKKEKICFFERDRNCDVTCRAYTEKRTCAIQDRLKHTHSAHECAAMLRSIANINKDPEKLAKEYPDLFPPPKLVYED